MSKQEAIIELSLYKKHAYGDFAEALEIAIEAIEKLEKVEEYIDELSKSSAALH